MSRVTAVWLAVLFGAGGCVPTITDDLATIAKPRVLAVASSPSEAIPGAPVALTALIAEPDGATRTSVDWELCVDRKPLTELGAVSPACLERGADATVADELGRGTSVMTAVPREACSLFGPNPPPAKAGETGGRPVDPDPTGGYFQPVVVFLGSEPALGAIRLNCGVPGLSPEQRVEFGERYRINENPLIDALTLKDGTVVAPGDAEEPVRVRPGVTTTFRAAWSACPRKAVCGDGICGEREDATSCADDCPAGASKGCTGAESYAWFDAGASSIVDRREAIVVTWYSTSGDFSDRRTGVSETDPDTAHTDTKWTAPSKPGDETLWAVIRDDRGGVSWNAYRISVR